MTGTGSPLVHGESCLLVDDRYKHFLLRLTAGTEFHFDKGVIAHDNIIGTAEGTWIESSNAWPMLVLRPRLADYVLRMKRGAAVMYPKDSGALLMWADIRPGCRVLEAGTGSGAMTLALARAVGDNGAVVTVDTREDHQRHATRLIEGFSGSVPDQVEFRSGDVVDHLSDVGPDRVVLDLPEPWHCAQAAPGNVRPGGILAAYVPTIPQVQQLRDAMHQTGAYVEVDTFEVMMRSWAVNGRSVRPEHRMVGHTGFITVGRIVERPG